MPINYRFNLFTPKEDVRELLTIKRRREFLPNGINQLPESRVFGAKVPHATVVIALLEPEERCVTVCPARYQNLEISYRASSD